MGPYLKKDIDLIERVQHWATKMIDGLKDLSYEQRLSRLNLTMLESRRLRGDLIEVFKILKGLEDVNYQEFFKMSTSQLRGHELKLCKKSFNSNVGKFSFSNRVVEVWNDLPNEVVSSSRVIWFKVKIDQLFKKDWGSYKSD